MRLTELFSLFLKGLCPLGSHFDLFPQSLFSMDKASAELLKILMSTSLKIILSSKWHSERCYFKNKCLLGEHACFSRTGMDSLWSPGAPSTYTVTMHWKHSKNCQIQGQDNSFILWRNLIRIHYVFWVIPLNIWETSSLALVSLNCWVCAVEMSSLSWLGFMRCSLSHWEKWDKVTDSLRSPGLQWVSVRFHVELLS